jgi:5-methylthioadenosine/S-adenosylhomocysteine deaminase
MKTVQGVIRHGRLLILDDDFSIVDDGAIAYDDGRIVAIGPTADIDRDFAGRSAIDAQGAVVRPGFIDAHVHVSQYTARSVLPRFGGGPLNMGHWKGEIRPEDEHASASLAAIDYLACGYTGFVDPGTIFEPDAVAQVADDIGIRIWLTDPYVADLGQRLGDKSPELISASFLARWPKSTDEAAARIGRELRRNKEQGLVRAFIGVYGENTESDELRSHAIRMAREAGVQFQMHLGYTGAAYRAQTERLGMTPLASIAAQNGLAPDLSFTHLNWVDDDDARLVASARPSLIWCPYGTLQMMGSGDARNRMAELELAGLAVALASDIPRAADFDGIAGLAAGCATACGQALDPRRLLAMRTRHAASSVGASQLCGRLAAGLSADIVIEKPHDLAVDPAWEAAVLSGRRTVRDVIVAGRRVFGDGHCLTADGERIRTQGKASAQEILSRIGA